MNKRQSYFNAEYVTPATTVLRYSCEGVLCLSPVGTTEDYKIHDETDW